MSTLREGEVIDITRHAAPAPAPRTAADFLGLSWALTRPVYALAAVLVLLLGCLGWWQLGGAGAVVVASGSALFILPTRIRIAPDGVTLRWLWMRRVIDYGEIEDVACYDEILMGRWREIGLRIHLRSSMLHLPMKLHDRLAFWVRDPMRDTEIARTWLLFHRESASLGVTSAEMTESPPIPARNGSAKEDER